MDLELAEKVLLNIDNSIEEQSRDDESIIESILEQ
jgi:hypothetical protein